MMLLGNMSRGGRQRALQAEMTDAGGLGVAGSAPEVNMPYAAQESGAQLAAEIDNIDAGGLEQGGFSGDKSAGPVLVNDPYERPTSGSGRAREAEGIDAGGLAVAGSGPETNVPAITGKKHMSAGARQVLESIPVTPATKAAYDE